MNITPTNIRKINAEIEKALKSVEKQFGVKIELGNSRYSSDNYATKLTVSTISEQGVVKSPLAKHYELYKEAHGFRSDLKVGDSFLFNGKSFVLKGYDNKKRKYPIIAEFNGKTYKLPIISVK